MSLAFRLCVYFIKISSCISSIHFESGSDVYPFGSGSGFDQTSLGPDLIKVVRVARPGPDFIHF